MTFFLLRIDNIRFFCDGFHRKKQIKGSKTKYVSVGEAFNARE